MKTKQKPEDSWWIDLLKTLGLSVFFAFGIRTYAAQSFYIPSGSMEPTLQINDRLMVDKVSYRFHAPERGDIVVFNPTNALKQQGYSDSFVKRIVGLPGDRVEIKQGEVFVNNRPLAEQYLTNPSSTFVATCSEGNAAFLAHQQTIPQHQYLVLGDNRNNSYDGRCWGLVNKTELVGKALFRFWPLNRVGILSDGK
jgi:signal peptidase I